MKIKYAVLVIALVFLTKGCYAEITGTVVDADTGKPIEGAVILVEWTKTKGLPGMSYTQSYKVIESVTDKDGKVTISGVFNPFANPPYVTIYKKGYAAWNNEYIFPDYKKRTDFKWETNYVFRLEKFKPECKYQAHVLFIHRAIRLGSGEKKLIMEAINWEENKAFEERQKNRKN